MEETIINERKTFNNIINNLHKKLNAKDKIINEQVLEIARLKEEKRQVAKYIKENKASLPMGRDEFTCEMRYSDDVVLAHKLLEILGDKQ